MEVKRIDKMGDFLRKVRLKALFLVEKVNAFRK